MGRVVIKTTWRLLHIDFGTKDCLGELGTILIAWLIARNQGGAQGVIEESFGIMGSLRR